MKKAVFWFMVCFMVMGMSTASVAADKPIELKFLSIHANVQADPATRATIWFADEMDKRTNGRVKVRIFWAGTMGGLKEIPFAIRDGLGDLGDVIVSYFQDHLPLNALGCNMIPMPFNITQLGEAMFELGDKYPQFLDEYARMNYKMLAWRPLEEYGIFSREPIRTLADLKGKKMRVTGPGWNALATTNGGIPVAMSVEEVYESLEKGLVDATPMGITEASRRRIDSVAKYYVEPLGAIMGQNIVMNLDRFNSLPADIQAIYTQLGRDYLAYWANEVAISGKEIREGWKKLGITVTTFTPEDLAKYTDSPLAKKAQQTWIEMAKGKGIQDAEAIVEKFTH